MRKRLLSFVCAAVAMLVLTAPSAGAQIGPQIEDGCLSNGGDAKTCRGPEHLAILAGAECRVLGGGDACEEIDGRTLDEDAVAAASDSWISHSLDYQRKLDDNIPFIRELWAHTHNSFNADGYGDPSLYGTDPNQTYTIKDQLRMGIRAVETDLHWAPSIHAQTGQTDAVLVCHGTQIQIDKRLPGVHAGCLPTDPTIDDRLPELASWLEANPDEVVMLYLENQLQQDGTDSPEGHKEAAAAISKYLGPYLYAPPPNACTDAPLDTLSRADIRAAGKQLIIVGNCETGATDSAWNGLVFSRGALWDESGLDYGDDFDCTQDRERIDYSTHWIRHWGDQTGLSDNDPTTLAKGEPPHGGGDVTVNDATNMVRCGVNMIGLDLLEPFDPRLAAMVWSWAPDEPTQNFDGACADQGPDGRFVSRDCRVTTTTVVTKRHHKRHRTVVETFEAHPFACFDGTTWSVTTVSDRFSSGDAECAAEELGAFAVPHNGYENQQLLEAKGDVVDVWVNSSFRDGAWAAS